MANSIEIDGILFTLLSKSIADNLVYIVDEGTRKDDFDYYRSRGVSRNIINARDFVKFTSTSREGTKILYAYRSTSELGIWRLGYLRQGDCGLEKFKLDYVQGTLLHHLLQKLINENFETLPFIPEAESGTKLITDGIINADYNHLTHEQITDPTFLATHRFILVEFSITEDTEAINNPERKIQLPPFSSISIKCDTKIAEDNIRTELGILSSNLESEYDLDITSNTHIVTYPFQEPNENIWNCLISMYTVQLRTKVPSENNVILVYCKYNMNYGIERTPASGCYGIALLKSSESAVNKYGLYSHFIDAGIYICKPVVYSRVCVAAEEELEKRKCSKNYVYVGDRYEHVFPYGQLHRLLSSGGFKHRKKHTTRQKKTTIRRRRSVIRRKKATIRRRKPAYKKSNKK
jgi:hypothetical protein